MNEISLKSSTNETIFQRFVDILIKNNITNKEEFCEIFNESKNKNFGRRGKLLNSIYLKNNKNSVLSFSKEKSFYRSQIKYKSKFLAFSFFEENIKEKDFDDKSYISNVDFKNFEWNESYSFPQDKKSIDDVNGFRRNSIF